MIRSRRRIKADEMTSPSHAPVLHLELHTANLGRALAFYSELLGWRVERIEAGRSSYVAIDLGDHVGGGAVECGTDRPLWIPYVAVPDITAATDRARRLGAGVPLEPREGPAGWRSVVAAPGAGEIALWESKT